MLKNIQLDEPDHGESLGLIADFYRSVDREDELMEYLEYRFESAREGENASELKAISLVLCQQIESDDPERAIAVYRAALERLPQDRAILERLIAKLEGEENAEERARLMAYLPNMPAMVARTPGRSMASKRK